MSGVHPTKEESAPVGYSKAPKAWVALQSRTCEQTGLKMDIHLQDTRNLKLTKLHPF